jgi:hypothetical protein
MRSNLRRRLYGIPLPAPTARDARWRFWGGRNVVRAAPAADARDRNSLVDGHREPTVQRRERVAFLTRDRNSQPPDQVLPVTRHKAAPSLGCGNAFLKDKKEDDRLRAPFARPET